MPILFYIHSKCLKDASQQHLPCIIFTASKQQIPNVESLTLTANWNKWTWNDKYVSNACFRLNSTVNSVTIIRTSGLCFMLLFHRFAAWFFCSVETGDYSNQTLNDCFCGKSVFCGKARGLTSMSLLPYHSHRLKQFKMSIHIYYDY